MANIAATRIRRELKEFRKQELASGTFKLDLVDDCWSKLQGEIIGPSETCYEGGRFQLDITVPETYPFNPPKVKFATKIWHPNISSVTGVICLDILSDQWAAAMSLRTVMLSIQALLSAPEPNDPQDAVVAKQFAEHQDLFQKTAKHWTAVYAGGKHRNADYDQLTNKLIDMGVQEVMARNVLSCTNWNLAKATENVFEK